MNDRNPQSQYCAVGLSNPKSPTNVGSVVRACGCFGADHIYYTGNRYDRAEPFYTDTADKRQEIPLTRVDNLIQVATGEVETAMSAVEIVCIELCENATPLQEFIHPDRALYLFGPEDHSLSQETINAADHVVFVATQGCLNLSATVNVVLYDRSVKRSPALDSTGYNNLVRSSRDCKNNLISGKNKANNCR